jgi:type II secretory pathway component PulJ
MSNGKQLERRINRALAALERRHALLEARHVLDAQTVVMLPLKQGEPPISYKRGLIRFYVPDNHSWPDPDSGAPESEIA